MPAPDSPARRPRRRKRELNEEVILAWADHHYQQTGHYPTVDSGPVLAARGENWPAVLTLAGLAARRRKGLVRGGTPTRHAGYALHGSTRALTTPWVCPLKSGTPVAGFYATFPPNYFAKLVAC